MIWNKSNRTYQNAFLCKVFDCVPPGAIFYYKYNNHCSSALSRVWTTSFFQNYHMIRTRFFAPGLWLQYLRSYIAKFFKTYRYISMFLLCRRLWLGMRWQIKSVREYLLYSPAARFWSETFPVNYARISCRLPLSPTFKWLFLLTLILWSKLAKIEIFWWSYILVKLNPFCYLFLCFMWNVSLR